MSTLCNHPRTGRVTTHPAGYTDGSHAATNVCARPECIAEAIAWGERYSGKQAHHVPDIKQKAEVPA